MKRTYLNLITIVALSVGTQVQALSWNQMNPANYMPEVSMPTVNWSAWNPMNYFQEQNQYYNAADRLRYFENKRKNREHDLKVEKQRKAGVSAILRSDTVLQDAVARAQKTCGKESASYAECEQALAVIEQVNNNARRCAGDMQKVEFEIHIIKRDIEYYDKKIAGLESRIAREGKNKHAAFEKQEITGQARAQVAAREAQLRREREIIVREEQLKRQYEKQLQEVVEIDAALDKAALASARETNKSSFGMNKPEMPAWMQSVCEKVGDAVSTLKEDWKARREYSDYSVTTNDSITKAGIGAAVLGTVFATRKFSALRRARLWNQAYGMNALMPRTQVMKLGDSANCMLQKAGAQIKGDY